MFAGRLSHIFLEGFTLKFDLQMVAASAMSWP